MEITKVNTYRHIGKKNFQGFATVELNGGITITGIALFASEKQIKHGLLNFRLPSEKNSSGEWEPVIKIDQSTDDGQRLAKEIETKIAEHYYGNNDKESVISGVPW